MALRLSLLLLVLFSTSAYLCSAEPVLDEDGNPVQPDTDYYLRYQGIIPLAFDNYDLVPTKVNGTYYVGVVPKPFQFKSKNVPVRFHQIFPGPVSVGDRSHLGFSAGASLGKGEDSGFWTLEPRSNGDDLLATTGEGSWFMIVPSNQFPRTYGLRVCPCGLCTLACQRVGRVDGGYDGMFLGVDGSGYEFMFVKKGDESINNHLRKYSSE